MRNPAIGVTNQAISVHFAKWLSHLANEVGPVELWTGNMPHIEVADIHVHQTPHYDKSNTLTRLSSWIGFSLMTSWHFVWRSRHLPILVFSNPPLMPLLAWILWKLQKRRYALMEWDIYPQILSTAGILHDTHPVYVLWYRWHAAALRDARVVITINDGMANELKSMVSERSSPIRVIPNWVDTDWIYQRERSEISFAQEQNLDDKLVIMYAGNLGATHSIETIVSVAEMLRDDPEVCFLIIGEGAKHHTVHEAIQSGRTPNITLLTWQPEEMLPSVLASADISIVTLAKGYERLAMPSKTYNSMAAGSAILGISQAPNDLAQLITRHQCGANFGPEAITDIVEWIRLLSSDRQYLRQLGAASRDAAVCYYGRKACEAELTATIKQFLLEQS